MNTMTKFFFVALALAGMTTSVLADSECVPNAKSQAEGEEYLKKAEAAEKAGRIKDAYDATSKWSPCFYDASPAEKRFWALRRRTGLKLGEEAERKGHFVEAFKYYDEHLYGIAADRVQMKMAVAKPGDFKTVQGVVGYFRSTQENLKRDAPQDIKSMSFDKARDQVPIHLRSKDDAYTLDPDRNARLKAVSGYLGKLQAIATKEGEKYLADEDRIFSKRKTSVMAKSDSLSELKKAKDWLGLFGQEKRANDRAVKRGDTLLADDSRKSLELAISYYGLAGNENKERKVRDKARGLGDAHLRKGEKKIAADYYHLAGLDDKASQLEEANEAEKEKTEAKRQDKFKKDQKSLEKELGF